VAEHHEKFDGTGYPAGKGGTEIELFARIVAVADTWDAMTTDRPYRAALSAEVAATELRRCAGTQFDPAVVEAFLAAHGEPGGR
jgi:HD-GYP domain-containing protein (c-di-GMP phosphodiesterase class II)